MKCEYCANEGSDDVMRCPNCGAELRVSSPQFSSDAFQRQRFSEETAQAQAWTSATNAWQNPYLFVPRKSRVAYVLLAIFLGELGVHNFYAGYVGRGMTQLLITLLSFGLLFWVSWIWAVVELCTVSEDGRGITFE